MSFKENSEGINFHAHFIDFLPKEISILEKEEGFSYSYELYHFSKSSDEYIFDVKSDMTTYAAYCANRRVEIFNRLSRKFDNILYVDVDTLIRNPLGPLFDLISDSKGFLILERLSNPETSKFATGVIGVNVNVKTLDYLRLWREELQGYMNSWFGDQVSMYITFMFFQEKEIIKKLDFSYIDWTYSNDSAIWVGKGKRKFEKNAYVKNQDRLVKAFNQTFRVEKLSFSFRLMKVRRKLRLRYFSKAF